MRIEKLLRDSAARHGGAIAVVAGKSRHTYAELDARSDRLASALQARGLARGDCVATLIDGGWPAIVSLFAVLKSGAVFHVIDPLTAVEDLVCLLRRERAVAIVTGSRTASIAAAALAGARTVRLVVLAGGNAAPATATCLSFEDVVGRMGPALSLRPEFEDVDPAVAFGGELPLRHWEIVDAAAEKESTSAAMAALAPWGSVTGLIRIIAAIREGTTVVLGKRSERAALPVAGVADPWTDLYVGPLAEALDSPVAARG